jgi:thiosulfate/3-mercaptopyruvate sulfurtransferase
MPTPTTRAVLAMGLLLLGTAAASASPRDRQLVSAAWLKTHLADRNLVLLQVGPPDEYDKGHIPGARYLAGRSISTPQDYPLALELPPIARLDSVFGALGVGPGSKVVLYFTSEWFSPTTRAWFTLEYMGLGERAVMLDGGLAAWKAAGGEVTTSASPVPSAVAPLKSVAHPEWLADADWIQARLGQPRVRIIDARNTEFYRGLEAGGSRPGHLPGAKSLPFDTVFDSAGRFLPDAALRRLLTGAGVERGDQVVVYCHVGQQATAVLFAGRMLGYDVRLYDGSFQDWSRRENLAVEGGIPFTKGGLITPEALAARIAKDEVTVLDVRSDLNAYLANHIPKAEYLHYESLRATGHGVPGDVLPAASYAEIWSRLGLRRDRPVVVYGSGDAQNFNATFVAWLLAGFRHPEVYLLDGGYNRWTAEGREQSRTYPKITPTAYPSDIWSPEVTSGEHLQHALGANWAVIVDVRPADQYAGLAGAQRRRGHIPGAINHFWQDDLVAAGQTKVWKSTEELKAAYAAQGITPDKYVILYCNTGTEASHAYYALRFLLGYQELAVYVPSWTEWAERDDLPVEGSGNAAK